MVNTVHDEIKRGNFSGMTPEFGRVTDIQRLFGIKRGVLYRWINEGRIKSACIREPGNFKGIRLVSVDSVRRYIESQMEEITETE